VISLECRRLGRTGHESSVITLGCCAIGRVSQKEADRIIEYAFSHGVNHFDVAPTYGEAELRLRPWLKENRDEIFLACKTVKRSREDADEELRMSLDRMGIDYIDLYQFHGLDDLSDLETAFSPEGALQAMVEAKDEGLIGHIGITSHVPPIIVEAAKRYDLDTMLFPLNFVLRKHHRKENDYGPLIEIAKEKGMGTIIMKAFAKGPWSPSIAGLPRQERPYFTWYEPFNSRSDIDRCLNYALSQEVTTIASPCDPRLVPKVIDSAMRYHQMSKHEQEILIESAVEFTPLFPAS